MFCLIILNTAAIFFGQTYLVRELLAAEAFFVFAFLGVTVVGGAVYLIGSVTMSWWAQGKPDVEEVHADLSEGVSIHELQSTVY